MTDRLVRQRAFLFQCVVLLSFVVLAVQLWRLQILEGSKYRLQSEQNSVAFQTIDAPRGVIYDRRAGQLQLSDNLFIIATGNRTEDKSGANRITSKLAGRTRRLDFEEHLDELVEYALGAGWPTELIQYLRFKPDAVCDWDSNRFQNATPRTWEDVARMPAGLDADIELANIAGSVGEGRAAEYVGFKQIYDSLPDITEILMNPTRAPVPENLAARYAVMGAVARKASADNFDNVCAYTDRFDPEFRVMCIKDAIKLAPAVKRTRAFQSWAVANADVLI